jgi:hypothetical protein
MTGLNSDNDHECEVCRDIALNKESSLPEVSGTFSVHDASSANWLIRQIVECRAYAQRCAEWAQREQRRAEREEQFFWVRYGPQLRAYVQGMIAEQGGKRKSVALPAGIIGFRTEAAKIVIDDEDAVVTWAKQHAPALVTVVERLSKSALNEHMEKTGELPEKGVHVEPEHEKFYIR